MSGPGGVMCSFEVQGVSYPNATNQYDMLTDVLPVVVDAPIPLMCFMCRCQGRGQDELWAQHTGREQAQAGGQGEVCVDGHHQEDEGLRAVLRQKDLVRNSSSHCGDTKVEG